MKKATQIQTFVCFLLLAISPTYGQLTVGIFDRIGTNNLSPTSGYPSGWGGGIHTWDLYAEGTIGVGIGGKLNAYMTSTGAAQFERIGTQQFSATSGYPNGWGGGVHTWDVYAEGSIGVGKGGVVKTSFDSQGNGKLDGNLVIGGNIVVNNTIVNLYQLLSRIQDLEQKVAALEAKVGMQSPPSGNYYLQISPKGIWYEISGSGYGANKIYYLIYIYYDGSWAYIQVQSDSSGNIKTQLPLGICAGLSFTHYVAIQINESFNGSGKGSNTVSFQCN